MDSKKISPLIDVRDVKPLINEDKVVIVDARGGADSRERYMEGHLAGAVFFDLETDLSEKGQDAALGGRHPLPGPRHFGSMLGKAGIIPSSHVLVYDDKAGANAAARFWWMMKAAGHSRVQVIDGGLAALQEEGIPLSPGPAPERRETAPYPVSSWHLPLADIDTVDRVRKHKDWLIIDVREEYRYRGEREPIDLIAGHIPGAVNVPYVDNLSANGRFRDQQSLATQFKSIVGDRTADRIIVHCGSGVTACHTILALSAAGMEIPALYVGSWSEWSRNPKTIATGDEP